MLNLSYWVASKIHYVCRKKPSMLKSIFRICVELHTLHTLHTLYTLHTLHMLQMLHTMHTLHTLRTFHTLHTMHTLHTLHTLRTFHTLRTVDILTTTPTSNTADSTHWKHLHTAHSAHCKHSIKTQYNTVPVHFMRTMQITEKLQTCTVHILQKIYFICIRLPAKMCVSAFMQFLKITKISAKINTLRRFLKIITKKAKPVSNLWNKRTISVKIFWWHENLTDFRENICFCDFSKIKTFLFQRAFFNSWFLVFILSGLLVRLQVLTRLFLALWVVDL